MKKEFRRAWKRLLGAMRRERTDARLDADLDEEIASHIEMMTEDNVRAGMSPEQARQAARRTFGHVESAKESYRDQRGMRWPSILRQDLKYAWRGLRRSPGFALTAIATLGLGLGLSSALFAILNGVLLKPLPGVPDPGGLVALEAPVSYPEFEAYRDEADVLESAAAYIGPVPFGVALDPSEGARPERLFGHLASPEYFAVLGVEPMLGRLFAPETERRGDAPVVVVSERFWRTRLDADARAIGRRLRVNGREAQIIGVAPKGFHGLFPTTYADLYVPTTAKASIAPELSGGVLEDRRQRPFRVVMRPARGVSREQTAAALDTLARNLRDDEFAADRERQGRVVELVEAGTMIPVPERQRSAIYVVYSMLMTLILTFTCANLAGVTLARGQARAREIAIRLSVGAHRRRIVSQLLIESLLLAVAGGIFGLVCASGMIGFLNLFSLQSTVPIDASMGPDWRVAGLTLLAAALAAVGFGLAPALAASRPNLTGALNGTAGATGRRPRRFGLRNAFMTYQLAAAMALLLVMGFLILGMTPGSDTGLDANLDDLYVFRLDPPRDGYTPEETATLVRGLPERLERVPGVESATYARQIPLSPMNAMHKVSVPDDEPGNEATVHSVAIDRVGPGYFATLRANWSRGLEFPPRLSNGETPSVRPVVINRSMADKLYADKQHGGDDPLGQVFDWGSERLEVIGVVDHGRRAFLSAGGPAATMYLELSDAELGKPPNQGLPIVVRTKPGTGFEPIRAELERIDARLTPFDSRTLRERLDEFDQMVAASSSFHAGIALFALILACVGLAGVTAQSVVRRRRELAIRLAMGAPRKQLLGLVMREGLAVTLVGGALGFGAAWALARSVSAMNAQMAQLVGSGTIPTELTAGTPALLGALALAACYLPAARTARLNPAETLREE